MQFRQLRFRCVSGFYFAWAILLLAACDGQRDVEQLPDTPAPLLAEVAEAPTLTVTATSKTLHFNWSVSDNATHYRLFQNADGASGFTQIGDDLTTTQVSYALAVHWFDWPNAQFLVEACNSHGCSASNEITATNVMLQAIGKIQKSAEPDFGINLALSADGSTLAIPSRSVQGVYVYRRAGGGWATPILISATSAMPAGQPGEGFGMSLALSADGNTLAVGAPLEDGLASNAGAAYVYKRLNNLWSYQAYVKASNPDADDGFGQTLALSGDGLTLAVGAVGEASNATGVNGNQLNNSLTHAGAVYVFGLNNNLWQQQVYLKSNMARAMELFGGEIMYGGNALALSADGTTLAVGNGNMVNGCVYTYRRSGQNWSWQQTLQSGVAGDFFGRSVSLSADGGTLAIGANQENFFAGGVYLFTQVNGSWVQQAHVHASNAQTNDVFGRTVTLSADGNTLAVAAYEDSAATGINGNQYDNSVDQAGAVYVFQRQGAGWQQRAYVKRPEVSAFSSFGRIALALSSDGETLAAGAYAARAVYWY